MTTLQITLTPDQAAAMTRMLDLAIRIHLCQFGEIEYMARTGELKMRGGAKMGDDQWDEVAHSLKLLAMQFGFLPGASHGIGSMHVSIDAHRAYELKKVVEKTLAEWRNPIPEGMRGVNYDGLGPRYTNDPAPVAKIEVINEKSIRRNKPIRGVPRC